MAGWSIVEVKINNIESTPSLNFPTPIVHLSQTDASPMTDVHSTNRMRGGWLRLWGSEGAAGRPLFRDNGSTMSSFHFPFGIHTQDMVRWVTSPLAGVIFDDRDPI